MKEKTALMAIIAMNLIIYIAGMRAAIVAVINTYGTPTAIICAIGIICAPIALLARVKPVTNEGS